VHALPRYTRSSHLVELVAEAERLAALLEAADPAARRELAAARLEASVHASLALDGARAADLPALDAAQRVVRDLDVLPADARPTGDRAGTWLDALRVLDEPADAELRALEVLGTAAALGSDDLAERLLTDMVPALGELHRRLTRGLVAPDRAGAPRQVHRAIQDGAVGRVIYYPADPAAVPGELALLGTWAASTGAREHALVASGVLHLEVLRIHPFDAANGRLARAAARLVLRARGLDPDGVGAPELALASDALGYHEEVARTRRRRDHTIWLERWGEAVTQGLRAAARDLDVLAVVPPERGTAWLAGRDDPRFSVADYRAEVRVGPEQARADLDLLLDAGVIVREPGSRGLRFRLAPPATGAS
jgi:fido (protein-threonine AMPylation protein)